MKKITIILILFSAFIIVFKPASSYAWDDCIFGETNDSFPGDCARYIDTDNDNICDHSQPAPEDRITSEVSKKENIQETKNPIIDKLNQDYYNLGLITIILFLGYGASFLLTKFKKINIVSHRKFWNIVLTLNFVVMGSLGILLTLKIPNTFGFNLPFNIVYWHVETGIIFTVIAVFHLAWHLPYYKNLLK